MGARHGSTSVTPRRDPFARPVAPTMTETTPTMADAPCVFDDAETREETRATVAEMDLEIVTERIVRDEVVRRLRARYPARASFDVSRDVVSSEIDAFLRGLGDVETETHKRERDDDDDETAGAAATTSSPTLARIHKQRRVEEGDEDVTTRVRRALGALGAEGGDAKSIAGLLKIDKSAANRALYALRARGEATADASSGGAPRWTASGGGTSEAVPVRTAPVPVTATAAVKAETTTEPETEAVENQVVALASNKRVTVRKWKNATLVDIREYYQIGGEGPYKPGKKGISLSTAQWRALRERLGDVAAAVEACRASGAETTVCEMSNTRRCSVSKFKGRVLVNVREYYEKDGRLLPGAKGAALSAEAAAILVANAEKIDERVRQLGE